MTASSLDSHGASMIRRWLATNFWQVSWRKQGLFVSSLYVWIPVQVVNLYWVPLPFRVLYMNISVMVYYYTNAVACRLCLPACQRAGPRRQPLWVGGAPCLTVRGLIAGGR